MKRCLSCLVSNCIFALLNGCGAASQLPPASDFTIAALPSSVSTQAGGTTSPITVSLFNEWREDSEIEPTVTMGATTRDTSASGNQYTQGLVYQGYGTTHPDILREELANRREVKLRFPQPDFWPGMTSGLLVIRSRSANFNEEDSDSPEGDFWTGRNRRSLNRDASSLVANAPLCDLDLATSLCVELRPWSWAHDAARSKS